MRADTTTKTQAPQVKEVDTDVVAPAKGPNDADLRADEFQEKVRKEQAAQFARLKDEARAIFSVVEGRPGVKSPAEWQKRLEAAGDEIGNGRFIVRSLGAERYLDAQTVAVLITLRQNLIAEIGHPSTIDIMMIDTAVVAYYNFLRVQRWIGNSSLVFEGELFGKSPLSEIHGELVGDRVRSQIERLAEVMIPIQDRTQRMMVRSLAQLSDRSPPAKS